MHRSKHDRTPNSVDSGSKPTRDDEESAVLFDRVMSKAEYEESCRNLGEFFGLLKAWREGGLIEPPEH
jgi:hypothetical protein